MTDEKDRILTGDTEVSHFDIDVPDWIDQSIDIDTLVAIMQGGCASGSYMPAVTYYTARQTMNESGDDVLQYIQDSYGELPKPDDTESWSGMACYYLSFAVELWVREVAQEIIDNTDDIESAVEIREMIEEYL
jgi:hypothetical protein